MSFNKQCDLEMVIPFDGFIVYDKNDVRWWMGTNENGLKAFISKFIQKTPDLDGFRIFKEGKFVETVREYREREMKEHEERD